MKPAPGEALARLRDDAREAPGAASLPPGVAACLAALGLPPRAWRGRIALRIHSAIHRASQAGTDVVIKECFDPRTRAPDPAAARREFAALARVAEAAHAPPLVPAPLVLCEDAGAFAMRFARGVPLTAAVLGGGARGRGAALGAAAGRWLRRFHDAHPLPARRGDYAGKLAFVREIRARRGDDDALLARAAGVLERTAAAAAGVELPASWIHGDMKSDNLLVDGDEVVGIDVHAVDENTVVYDLAPFVNHLRLIARSPRGLAHRRELSATIDAFLGAYDAHTAGWRLPLLWLRAYLLMQPLASASRSWRSRIAQAPRRRELAHVVGALAAA